MKKRREILSVIMAFGLLLGLSGTAIAAGMSGMDMGNSSTVQNAPNTRNSNSQDSVTKEIQTQPSNQAGSNAQHEAIAGMNSNMPGMQSNEEHANGNGSGVDWPVVNGFLIINLLVIGTAGVLRFKKKIQSKAQI